MLSRDLLDLAAAACMVCYRLISVRIACVLCNGLATALLSCTQQQQYKHSSRHNSSTQQQQYKHSSRHNSNISVLHAQQASTLHISPWRPQLCLLLQRKLSHLRRKLWREAGPPPDLATRLFSERIIYLVCLQPSLTDRKLQCLVAYIHDSLQPLAATRFQAM
eukprot:GHRQ01036126.1.p1 GENE.GHRQ01036126.1~~GHRQ01036126.1.p1  ORF type:complete len:175 (+),score=35.93 GHRQ01036126.1:37-525(+)